MALDIHRLENGQPYELLYSIGEAAYELLAPAFNLFKQRTGLTIDPYGDLQLSSGLQALIDTLNSCLQTEKNNVAEAEINLLLKVLTDAQSRRISIIFCGD